MKAVARHPFMAAGSDRFDTTVMEALGERVYCKVGAEAVFCASFPERGLGVAIISTSTGLLTDRQATKRRMGGEVLAYVW